MEGGSGVAGHNSSRGAGGALGAKDANGTIGEVGQVLITWYEPIEISGKLYNDEGVTADTSGSDTIKIAIGTSTVNVYATTTTATGFWGFKFPVGGNSANSFYNATDTPMVAWLDGQGVIVRTENTGNTATATISDFAKYDSDNDSDIQFTANNNSLNIKAGQMLYLWPGVHLAATTSAGITIQGGATSTSQMAATSSLLMDTDGSLKLAASTSPSGVATSSILSMNGNTLTLAGSFLASSTSIFNSIGTTTFNATTTVAKNIIATSTSFYNLEFGMTTLGSAVGSWQFGSPATTTNNFAVITGTVTLPDTDLFVGGNFSNTGRIISSAGTTTFNGTTTQYLSGFMVGTSTFTNVNVSNNTANATTTFVNSASTTGTFMVNTAGVGVEFPAGATSTFQNLSVTGTAGNEVYLHSGTPGSQWNIHVPGSRSVNYANIKDSDACTSDGNITTSNSTDGGNNDCWSFPIPPSASSTISSAFWLSSPFLTLIAATELKT